MRSLRAEKQHDSVHIQHSLTPVLPLCCHSGSLSVQFRGHDSVFIVTVDYYGIWEICLQILHLVSSWAKLVIIIFLSVWKFLLITVTYLCLEYSFPQFKNPVDPDGCGFVRMLNTLSNRAFRDLWDCVEGIPCDV